jgi:hypothetical protein
MPKYIVYRLGPVPSSEPVSDSFAVVDIKLKWSYGPIFW